MSKKGIGFITEKEVLDLKRNISHPRNSLIISILFETGCTVSELVKIKITDVDFSSNSIHFPKENTKTKRTRTSQVSLKLISEVKSFVLKKKQGYLLGTRQSDQMTTKRVRQLIQQYTLSRGLGKLTPQIIRYSHIAHALSKGISIWAIQKQIGIEKLRMIQILESIEHEEEADYNNFFER